MIREAFPSDVSDDGMGLVPKCVGSLGRGVELRLSARQAPVRCVENPVGAWRGLV